MAYHSRETDLFYFLLGVWKTLKWAVKKMIHLIKLLRNDPVQFLVNMGLFFVMFFAGTFSALLVDEVFRLIGLDKFQTFDAFSGLISLAIGVGVVFLLMRTVFQDHKLKPVSDYMTLCRTKKDDESVMICISREIEGRLEKWFDAEGRGLNEKLDFVLDKGEVGVPESLVKSIRFIATIRNKIVHSEPNSKIPERKELFEKGNEIISRLHKLSHPTENKSDGAKKHSLVIRYGLAAVGIAGIVSIVFLMVK